MGRFSEERKKANKAAGGGAAEGGGDPPADNGAAETPAGNGKPPRQARTPRASKPAADAGEGLELVLQVVGGPAIPLPAGSRLHVDASKLVDVLYPAE